MTYQNSSTLTPHHNSLRRQTHYSVNYLKNGKSLWSPWFKSLERAEKALSILQSKGYQAIVLVD